MIDFPANPVVGQAFQSGNTIYKCVSINPAVWSATVVTSGIPDAPADGKPYSRKDGAWYMLTKADVGLGNVDNTSDANKPISTATAAALATKEPTIVAGTNAQYWRGDKAWATLNPAAVGLGNVGNYAAVAKTGDTMTGQLNVPKVLTPSVVSASDRLLLQSDTFIDHVNVANSLWVTARAGVFLAQNGGDAIQAPNGNISTSQMLYAGSPGVRTIGPVNADGAINGSSVYGTNGVSSNGRVQSNASGDVAAIYAPNGGIYSAWGSQDALRATAGGCHVATNVVADSGCMVAGAGNDGNGAYRVNNYYDDASNNAWAYALACNPAWNMCRLAGLHVRGNRAGFRMDGAGQCYIDFVLSGTAGQPGSIQAAAFTVVSDERNKESVAELPQQHDAYMRIKPISWRWPTSEAASYPDLRDKWGFSAQNMSEALPLAVIGNVNEYDAEGKPVSANVDTVPIAALTVLEVQALWERIGTLESRLNQLEGAAQ